MSNFVFVCPTHKIRLPSIMKIISVNAGRPRIVVHQNRQYSTAINKSPLTQPAQITPTGIDIDKQADKKHHGGPELALCCYPNEHYTWAEQHLNATLSIPAFGENLTTHGLIETEACIGDIYEINNLSPVTIQITQPREPCVTLARKHNSRTLGPAIHETGHTGFYCRVLQTGQIFAGDTLQLIERPNPHWSVHRTMRLMFNKDASQDELHEITNLPGISSRWQKRFLKRIT